MKVNLEHSRGTQPLYVQLARAIEEYIAREKMQPGDLLPSESVLAADNNLSRATILKAYDLLLERGRISRRQGKGTFVRERPMERMLPDLNSFSDHVRGLGLSPSNVLLSFENYAPGATNRPAIAMPDDIEIVVMERLRQVDDAPVGIQRVAIPGPVAARIGLVEARASQSDFSFYASLREHSVLLGGGEESLRAINADATEAELLEVPEGTALIEVTRHSRDSFGDLVEIVRARYLGSKYLYHVTLAPFNGESHHEDQYPNPAAHRPGGGINASAVRLRH